MSFQLIEGAVLLVYVVIAILFCGIPAALLLFFVPYELGRLFHPRDWLPLFSRGRFRLQAVLALVFLCAIAFAAMRGLGVRFDDAINLADAVFIGMCAFVASYICLTLLGCMIEDFAQVFSSQNSASRRHTDSSDSSDRF